MVACARKRSRIAVAAGTSPRKMPQSCVGRFVVMSVDAVSCRRTKTLRILGGVRSELLHAEVFEHEQVDARELLDEIAARAGRVGLGEVGGEIEGAAHERASAGPNRADGDRRRDVRFADAGRTDEQHAVVGLDKPRAGQFDDLGLGDLRIEVPVEIGERLHDGDAGLFEAAREEAIGAAGELVLHEQFEKLEMRERRGFGLRDAPGRASTMPDSRRCRRRVVSWAFIVKSSKVYAGSSGESRGRRWRASAGPRGRALDELADGLIAKVLVRVRLGDGRQDALARMAARQAEDALNQANGADAAGGERGVGPLLERGAHARALARRAIDIRLLTRRGLRLAGARRKHAGRDPACTMTSVSPWKTRPRWASHRTRSR